MKKLTMLDYVRLTPDVLKENLARSAELVAPLVEMLKKKPYRVLRIVASGSSSNASNCARPFLRHMLGMEVLVTTPYTFTHHEHELPDDELTVVVSQSGYSTNALDALDAIRAAGHPAVGLCVDLASDMKDHADVIIDYGVGVETVGYVTKGVTSFVLFLMLFALEGAKALGKIDEAEEAKWRKALETAIEGNISTLERTLDYLNQHYMELSSMNVVYLCGSGSCMGAAMEGALKIAETLQIPAIAYETEEYVHGPELQMDPNHTVFFLTGSEETWGKTTALWEATCMVTRRSYLITADPNAPEDDRVFQIGPNVEEDLAALYILPIFQIISYQLTEDKHLWHKHPLCVKLENAASGKSANYVPKEVM